MITLLQLDILECEVKWALGSITMNKASGLGSTADAEVLPWPQRGAERAGRDSVDLEGARNIPPHSLPLPGLSLRPSLAQLAGKSTSAESRYLWKTM